MFGPGFHTLDDLPQREVLPGVRLRIVAGDRLMLTVVDFDQDAVVPTHAHPHEQAGVVLAGTIEMWIGDDRRRLKPGDPYLVLGGMPHGARALAGPARVLDAFHPLRDEYLALFR